MPPTPERVFHSFSPVPTGAELALWEAWFSAHGIDPGTVDFDGVPGVCPSTWVERRANPGQNEIVYLKAAMRDGEPIVAETVVVLAEPPAPFPV